MNKLVAKILKESGVKAKVTNDSKKPRFRVVNSKLTLEGTVTRTNYSMVIKDIKGKVVDELSVSVKNGNDVANRIHESINTLNTLSPIYDNMVLKEEDAEFEDLPEGEPGDINTVLTSLSTLYDNLMELAENTKKISNSMEEDDAEGKNFILSLVGSIYDIAIDVDKYKEDLIEELHGDSNESLKKSRPVVSQKVAVNSALNNLSVCEAALKGYKSMDDICLALKDIKSELIVRGC